MKKFTFIIIVLTFAIIANLSGQNKEKDLANIDDFITQYMESVHKPGFSACIIKNDSIVWRGNYGYANLEDSIMVTKNRLFNAYSIGKSITAASIMKLREDGFIDLDENVNSFLPFQVDNPYFEYDSITPRMLMTHTSSIKDFNIWNYVTIGDATMTLAYFLENYLSSDGEFYSNSNFSNFTPGSHYQYSNIGSALNGYLAEALLDTLFKDYAKDSLLAPLQMENSAWFLSEIDIDSLAYGYSYEFVPYPQYGHPAYPGLTLKTSSEELSHYVIMLMNGGKYIDNQVIEESTVDTMCSLQMNLADMGLGLKKEILQCANEDKVIWGHKGGSVNGFAAEIQFCPDENIGVVYMSNSNPYATEVLKKLFEYGALIIIPEDATNISETGFTANWQVAPDAVEYYFDVAYDLQFSNYIEGYENLNVGLDTIFNVTGLEDGTEYYYRLRAYNAIDTGAYSNIVSLTTLTNGQIIHIPEDYSTIQEGINAANTGDTVLVAPGTYVENINFNGKNITIASHYLINPDTSLISQTIIDGNQNGRVVTMNAGILNGFTISHGYAECENGGGIHCLGSEIGLLNLIICNNTTILCPYGGGGGFGGGIFCDGSPIIDNIKILDNFASYGGGICINYNTSPTLEYVVIANNIADYKGGGVYCVDSNPVFQNVIIENNSVIGGISWGGIPIDGIGGGISFFNSDPVMKNVTIRNNVAKTKAGGVFFSNSQPVFDSIERCNIYMNNAFDEGNDLYSENPVDIILDTFTVINPTSFLAVPLSNFTFNILDGVIPQANADLYVSPNGDNANSGLTAGEPLKTIYYATRKILTDSINPHSIFLLDGTYSTTSNNEWFPVCFPDYVTLAGTAQNDVILDAEQNSRVIRLKNNKGTTISNMTVTGGYSGNVDVGGKGGGIYCENSNVSLQNLSIIGNTAIACSGSFCDASGGGLYFTNSEPFLQNLTVSNNSASYGGGIYCRESTPVFTGGAISNNSSTKYGGGIYFINSNVIFDSINRCSIYLNHSLIGKDLYSSQYVEVFVDTFTVLNPTSYFIQPFANFSMNVLYGLIPQISADLYVSPEGDNNNSGLTSADPFKTIDYAMTVILSTETDPHTIHLLSGTYAPSTNGEMYPLVTPEYLFIDGESESSVILDAEGLSGVLEFYYCQYAEISNMTITGGYKSMSVGGAGMVIWNSNPLIQNVTINGNSCFTVTTGGGGVWCTGNSSPVFKNTTVTNNTTSSVGGGMACYGGAPKFENVVVSNNSTTWFGQGGGIYFSDSNPV